DLPKRRGRPRKSGEGNSASGESFFRQFSGLRFSDKERLVRTGISNIYTKELAVLLRIDWAFMEEFLLIDPALFVSMKEEELFDALVSDRIMALMELYNFGVEIMGNFELFNEWMKKPSKSFVFHRPLD